MWQDDPIIALETDAAIEDLADYWERVVRVSHDQGPGLLEVRVRAFDRDMARSAGVPFVGVSWGYHAASSLGDVVIDEFSALRPALARLWGEGA